MLLKRELGEIIACSIGTAIPLEKIITGEIPNKDFTHLYMNLKTLHRNFYGSFLPTEIPDFKIYLKNFIDELLNIKAILTESLLGAVQPVFYIASNKSLAKDFKYAKLKQRFTPKQKNYYDLEKKILIQVMIKLKELEIQDFDILVKGYKTSALLISHYPLDLLSYYTFRKLVLLESHTGALKTKVDWITKLTKNEKYLSLPFNIIVLQIVGDHSLQFENYGTRVIETLVNFANSKRWTTLTTLEKIRFDLRSMPDKFLSSILLEMSAIKLK